MHFGFSEDQLFLQETARRVAADMFDSASVRRALSADGVEVRRNYWAAITEMGWAGVLVPEEQGGSGGSLIDACILAEVLAGVVAPVPFLGSAIGVASIARAVGDVDVAAALASGTPLSLAVDGRLRWPSEVWALAFDWLPGAEVVSLDGNGAIHRSKVTPGEVDTLDLLHPLVALPAGLVGFHGGLTDELRRGLAAIRVGVAASSLGLADAALREAVDYSKQRVQYGRPIGEFQALQHLCAEMLVDVEASRSMVYGAAWAVESAPLEEAERVAAAAKAWCGPSAIDVCENGIQVLGGIGVTWEHDAHLRLRQAHLMSEAFGSPSEAMESLAVASFAANRKV